MVPGLNEERALLVETNATFAASGKKIPKKLISRSKLRIFATSATRSSSVWIDQIHNLIISSPEIAFFCNKKFP